MEKSQIDYILGEEPHLWNKHELSRDGQQKLEAQLARDRAMRAEAYTQGYADAVAGIPPRNDATIMEEKKRRLREERQARRNLHAL